MANVITTASNIDDSVLSQIDAEVIVSGAGINKIDPFVEIMTEPVNGSYTFTIYTKLSKATTPLTDGTEVDSVGMADTGVEITPVEHGNVVTTTNLVNLQTGGKADRAASKLVGINLAETTNQLGVNALESGTNTTAASTAGTLAKGDLRAAYEKLSTKRIPKINGLYVAFLNPAQITDIKDDYIDIVKYGRPELATSGVVGVLEGFLIVEDPDVTAGKVSCFGFNALGKSISQEVDTQITGPFDKLGRMMHFGWYGVIKYGKVDDNAIEIITGA